MIYLVGDKRYDIPQDENENFLSVNPDARAVVTASGKRFAIPQDKLTDFFAQYPDASYMDRESYDTYEAQMAQAAAPQGEPQAEPARRGAVRRFLDGLRQIPSQIAERNQVDTDQDDRLSLAQSFAAMGAYTAATGAGMGLGSPMTGVKQDGEPILSQETKEAIDQAEVESAIRHTERDINRRKFAAALQAVSDRFFLPPFANAGIGLYHAVADVRAVDMGINDALDGEAVLNTLQKQENGEPLTLEEDLLLDALAEKAWLEENTEVGAAYAIGQGVGKSLSYMIPIILSPASGAAKASAKLGVRLAVKARLGAGATRAAGIIFGTGGAAANAAVTELTSGAGGTYSEFLRRQKGDIRYEVTPEGYITFAGRDNVEDEHTAKRKALAKQFGEFFSEEFGAGFQLIGHGVGRGVSRMIGKEKTEALRTLLNKVPRLVNRSSSSEMARFVDDIAEAGKFSGSLVEYLEEVSNTILDSFLTGDSSISDLLDARQQIETLGTVVGTSALFGSFKAGGDMRYKHRARESMKESDAFLSDQEQDAKKNFLKDYGGWASVRATINGEDTDAAYEMLARIATDKKMPVEVRAQVLNYFTSGLAVQGHTIADLKKATDRQLLQESYALSDAYAAGYNSQDPRAIVREYEEARSKVDHEFIDNYGGGDISYLMDKRAAGGTEAADLRYMSAKQAYYGLIDRAEDISRTAANARRRYYEFRRQGDNLISVQSKDGDAYHIIEGNYVTDPNTGKVLSSDPTVVVVDSEGNKIIVGVNTLLPSSLRIEKADEVIEQQAQLAAAQAYNSVMGAAQTPMQDEKQTAAKRLRPGDTVTLSIEGGPVTATVGEFENGRYTITTQDKITIGEQTGTTFHLAPDELSALLDNGSIEEVNNREQEEGQAPALQQRETYHITDDDGDHTVEVVSRNEDGTIDIIFDGNPLITTQSQLQDLVDSSDEAAAARQEEQARAQAEAQAIAEEKAMPTREDGEPDYEKVSPERTLEYIENSGLEEQDIDNIIQNQLAQAQKTHKEASEAVQREFNSRPKAGTSIQAHKQALEDWNKRLDALRQQASDMYASVKYWNDVSALRQAKKQAAQRQKDTYAQQQAAQQVATPAATPAEPTAATPAAPVRPRRRGVNPTSYRARLMAAGTPRSLRECIIYEIVDGIKFVWGSPKGGQTVMRNFRPVYVPEKRGIGDLLHWSKKEKEQYRWMLSEEGYTPETLAEAIKDGLFANYGYNYEDMDMTDIVAEIEDVLLSHDRRSSFLEEIESSRRDEMYRYEEEGFYEMGYDGKADFEGEEAFYQSKILTEEQYRELITIFEDYYSQNDGHEQEQDLVGEDSQQGANPAAPDQGGGPAVDEAALRGAEPDVVPGVQGQDQGGSGVSQAPRHSVTPDRRGAGQNQGGLPGNTTDGDRQGAVRGSRGIELSPEARAAQEVASTEAFKRESEAFHKGLEGSMILRADALAKILKERFPETADVMRVVTHTTLRDQLIRDNVDWIRAQSILSNVQENHSVGLLTRGFYVSGKVYLVADDLMSVEDAAEAFVHEHQHMTNSQQGLADKVLADGLDRAQASAAVATLAGTTYYSDHSNKDLADELIAHVIERAYRTGETIEEIAAAVGITNKKVIETLNSIYNDNRDINAATDARRGSLLHRRNQPSDSRKNGADQEGRTREVGGQGTGSAASGQETGARYSVKNEGTYKDKDGHEVHFRQLDIFEQQAIQDAQEKSAEAGQGTANVQRPEDTLEQTLHLGRVKEGEICLVERVFTKDKNFAFTAPNKIESADDVAYIFRSLEDAAVENAFVVYIVEGRAVVQHVGMGVINETLFDASATEVMKRRLNPEKVYMVHNHPSGKLTPSEVDKMLFSQLSSSWGEKLMPGIIIDQRSGKYGLFGTDFGDRRQKTDVDASPITVYKFDRQVFASDYDFSALPTARSSRDVAAFISSQRLGDRNKVNLLVLSASLNINANIFLPYNEVKDKIREVAEDVKYYQAAFAGATVILYGTGVDMESAQVVRRLASPQASVIDAISIDNGNGFVSGSETGVFENIPSYGDQVAQAREDVDTDPTDGQKKAGNYRMGHVTIDGYDISIENPKGSVRSGKDASGKAWSVTMNNDYGYIRRTEGVDGDHIDVFLSDHLDDWDGTVYVVDQVDPKTGEFDEHKVMYGFNSMDEARDNYLANYSKGWKGLGTITGVDSEEFRSWVDSSHRKTKAFSEYKSVNMQDDVDPGEQVRYSLVTDPILAAKLESSETVEVYRAMTLDELGSLGTPMSSEGLTGVQKRNGKRTAGSKSQAVKTAPDQWRRWNETEEHQEIAVFDENLGYAHITIMDDAGGATPVAFNPYFHTSLQMLNDQFAKAWRRPNMVVVRCLVPKWEAEAKGETAYKAKWAKNSVGATTEWNNGPVSRRFKNEPRVVILSRYVKPIEVVSMDEYAQSVKDLLERNNALEYGVPFSHVTPEQRDALQTVGVPITEPTGSGRNDASMAAYNEWRENARFSVVFGGNRGYEGYSMSKRAAEARRDGRYPKTDFKKNYHVTDKALDALVDAGIIYNGEWHHTSVYGNRTTFYSWEEPWMKDAYDSNKKEIDTLAREKSDGYVDKIYDIIYNSDAKKEADELEKKRSEFWALDRELLNEFKKYKENLPIESEYTTSYGTVVKTNGRMPFLDMYNQPTIGDWEVFKDGEKLSKKDSQHQSLIDRSINEVKKQLPNPQYEDWLKETGRYDEFNEKRNEAFPESAARFSVTNRSQEIFVSNAQKAVLGISQDKATPQQWLAMIEKSGGMKAGEDKWLGLSDWLKGSDKKTLTKQDVLDFIAQNKITIQDAWYAEKPDIVLPRPWLKAFSYGADDFNDTTVFDIIDEDAAIEYFNQEEHFPISRDEEGDLSDADRERLLAFAKEKFDEADFEQDGIEPTRLRYTTYGLRNKREIALVVPTIEPYNQNDMIHFGDAGHGRAVAWIRFGETTVGNEGTNRARAAEKALYDYQDEMAEKYGISIDDIDAVYDAMAPEELVEHARLLSNVRATAKASKDRVLVIDEIQSKRHQDGRERGYKGEYANSKRSIFRKASDAMNEYRGQLQDKYGEHFLSDQLTEEENRRYEELYQAMLDASNGAADPKDYGVPDAPFEKNWHELAMKRMLRLAAEEGYDYLAWTKGEQQANRYNIGDYVSSIERQESNDGERDFGFYLGDSDDSTLVTTDDNGIILHADGHLSQAEGKPLSELVGKEIAVKMMAMEENDVLEDVDLKVGNQGMKGFYDQMLPRFMDKYGKQWGVKTQEITLPGVEEAGRTMWAVPVTEEMRRSVLEGQTMFSLREEIDQKGTQFYNDQRDLLNEVLKGLGIDITLSDSDSAARFSIVEAPRPGMPARDRNKDREAYKKAFKKHGEKAYDRLYQLQGGILATHPMELLDFLKRIVGVEANLVDIIEDNHDWLIDRFRKENPALFKTEEAKESDIPEVHGLLATKGYTLLEHTMDNGMAIGVKCMYRDKFVPTGKTDRSYIPNGDWHSRSVICYYSHPESNIMSQYVFTVTSANADVTPTAYELAADPSLMTPEWEVYLEKKGRKREDGTYNMEGLQPEREDPFSLSHLMIRIGRGGSHSVECISRYNHGAFDKKGTYHRVDFQPNSTLGNNLDKLVSGLDRSLKAYKDIKVGESEIRLADSYRMANDGKIYKTIDEANGIYFGEGFWIDYDNNARVVDPSKEKMMGMCIFTKDGIESPMLANKISAHKVVFTPEGVTFYTGGHKVTEEKDITLPDGKVKHIVKEMWADEHKTELTAMDMRSEESNSSIVASVANLTNIENLVAPNVDIMADRISSSSLVSVDMPKLKLADDRFLWLCRNLQSVNLPLLRSVGHQFLNHCGIKNVSLPSLEKVGDGCFSDLNMLESIDLPLLRETGDSVFNQCFTLTSASLPSLEVVTGYAFAYSGIKSLDAPKLRRIGDDFAEGCLKLTSVNMPSLKEADNSIFHNCSNLTSISLPEVRVLGGSAFHGCDRLEYIDMPRLRRVDYNFLDGVKQLHSVTLPLLEEAGDSFMVSSHVNGPLSLPSLERAGTYFLSTATVESVDLPLLEAAEDYFMVRTQIESHEVELPMLQVAGTEFLDESNVKKVSAPKLISAGNFLLNDSDVQEVEMPSLVQVGSMAFQGAMITNLSLPSLVTVDMGFARGMAVKLETVDLPKLEKAGILFLSANDFIKKSNIPNLKDWDEKAQKIRFSVTKKTDADYMKAVQDGDMETAKRLYDETREKAGYTIKAYHGTSRTDRVGTVFRPERATSGPMAFFTDNRQIAEGYTKKIDTSISYDDDYYSYETQFRTRHKDTGRDYAIYDLWGFIPFDDRRVIADKAKHVRSDWEGDGHPIYDEETTDANGAWDYQVRDYHGNILRALFEQWLDSGNLFNREDEYLQVLDLAGVTPVLEKLGFEAPRYMNPNRTEPAIYDVYLKMEKPFDSVEDVNEEFISGLEAFAEEHEEEFTQQTADANPWDKNNFTAEDFIKNIRDDIKQGNTFAWTAIPDVVTAYLKTLGYDGIKDSGGKNGGSEHTVYIPFTGEQVKSASPVTYDDEGDVIPLSKRFDQKVNDIRYSIIGETGARMLDIRRGAPQMMDALRRARQMETFGYDKKTIRLATGWEKGKDDLWRYEVDDVNLKDATIIFGRPIEELIEERKGLKKAEAYQDAEISRLYRIIEALPRRNRTDEQKAQAKDIRESIKFLIEMGKATRESLWKNEEEYRAKTLNQGWKLDDIIEEGNPTLKAYPDLGSTPVEYTTTQLPSDYYGAVAKRNGRLYIFINKNRVNTAGDFESTLRHELQHLVQIKEGFAQGGNDESIADGKETVDLAQFGLEGTVTAYEAYRRLAGEVESRNVSNRAALSPEERREKLLEETEDVARRDQIVLRGETPNAFAEADRLSERPALDALAEASRITRETARKERAEYRAMFSVKGDGAMTVRERLAAALLELSAGHEEDLRIQANAMTAVKGALDDVVKAVASAQKEYDQKTVSRVVRLARILIEGGMFDNSGRADIKRLIGLISETAGKKKIDSAVNAIVDQLLNRHLMNSEALLNKLTTLKDTRTNAQGITVQGKLDLKGQRMLRTFREAKELDIEDIKERIVDAANRMESADSVEAENAEIEYQALLLARRYREDIVARQGEEMTLKNTLAKAERDHRNRLIDAATLADVRRTVAEGLRECRLERSSAYLSIINDLDALVHDSMTAARAFRQAEVERIRRIHGLALRDVGGQPYSEQEGKKTVRDRIVNSWPVRFFLKPLATFDYMLRYFGRDSIDGRGHLWNEFMPRLQQAEDRLWDKTKQAMDTLNGKLTELFGKPMKWADLYTMERRMPSVDVTYTNGDRMASMRLTQGQLLYLYMIYKMNDGRMKLNAMGVDGETMARLTESIDPRIKALGDWIQDVFLRDKREEYNEVYERLFGAPMADIQNYFPLVISGRARTKEEDLNDYKEVTPSTITGNIIRRTRNSLPIDLKKANAFDVVIRHIESMEQWAAFAAINKDLNTLLSYNGFKNRVMDMSSARFGSRGTLYDNFRDVCRIAAGVYRPATKQDSLDSTMVNMAKGVTTAKISLRVNTAIKQLLSFPAFATSAAPWTLLSPKGAVESWNWAMENLPGFRKRWQSRQAGDSRLKETDADWGMWRNRIVETAQRIGMTPNAFIDGITVAIGSYATYKTSYRGYIKDGYDEATAKRKALLDASVVYNESQQSSVNAYVSAVQLDRTVAAVALTVFRNASMAYGRNMVHSLAMAARYLDKDFREKAIYNAKKMMMQDGLSEEQASRAAQRRYNQALWKHLANVALYGFILQFFWDLGEKYWYLLLGKDKDKKDEMLRENILQSLTGPIEGLAGGNALAGAVHSLIRGDKVEFTSGSLLPILSDIENITRLMGYDKVAGMNEIVNLLIQMGIGVNPSTLTDMAVAVVDACQGDMTTAREAMILALRVINAPQSQIDELYIDELQGYGSELREQRLEDLAERYAAYKRHKSSPLTGWAYTDMDEWRAEQRYIKRFNDKVKAREEVSGQEDYDKAYATYKRKASEVDKMLSDQEDRIDRARPDALKAAERISRVTASREYRVKQRVDECEKACEEIRSTYRDDKAMRDLMISLEREQAVRDIEEMD